MDVNLQMTILILNFVPLLSVARTLQDDAQDGQRHLKSLLPLVYRRPGYVQ